MRLTGQLSVRMQCCRLGCAADEKGQMTSRDWQQPNQNQHNYLFDRIIDRDYAWRLIDDENWIVHWPMILLAKRYLASTAMHTAVY